MRRAGHQGFCDAHRCLGGIGAHRFLHIAEHHVVHAVRAGGARAAKAGVHARQRLYFQGDVLNDVAHPGAALHPLEEAALVVFAAPVAVQGGQQGLHALEEPGDLVRGPVLEVFYVQPHHDEVLPVDGPIVGPAHGFDVKDPHR